MAKKDKIIPPSLKPRTGGLKKKSIPKAVRVEQVTPAAPKKTVEKVEEKKKERFTLWMDEDIYNAFKIHTATRKGSASDYIQSLIKKDLGIK